MKREGRQHGMVRTCRILPSPLDPRPPASKFVNQFDSLPTAGLFTKVQSKPTNHSKFTGKCSRPKCFGCHIHPARKAKDKTKGSYKLKSDDVVANYKLTSWKVVDRCIGSNLPGFSNSRILEDLSAMYVDDYDHDLEDNESDNHSDVRDQIHDKSTFDSQSSEINNNNDTNNGLEDDDDFSFCDVEIILDRAQGDEGWCIVEEM
ncbi:uncharacterized protein LOC110808997 [Carica papaya]|uniref:uncharacterized protein LOC110808997 n=1 Tax=Carica papaya TaxID=3649 RepID=UPI000B8CE2AE|nr:uncharacterized protein LOC110808997 [Carica papaya]